MKGSYYAMIAAAALSCAACTGGNVESGQSPVKVKTWIVSTSENGTARTFSGTVEEENGTAVSFPTGGTIRSIDVAVRSVRHAIEYIQDNRAVIHMWGHMPYIRPQTAVYFAVIDFELITESTKKNTIVAAELSKFPEVKRDLALMVDKNVTFS